MWKPVILNSDVFDKSIDGLIGIEEFVPDSHDKPVALKIQEKKRKQNNVKKPKNNKKLKPSVERIALDTSDVGFLKHMKSWAGFGINDAILKALHHQKFLEPTDIQQRCLGPALSGRDLLACAETGSGKTLAFAIPMVNAILEAKEKGEDVEEVDEKFDEEDWEEENAGIGCVKVKNLKSKQNTTNRLKALVLTPTRELAVQVKDHIEAICMYTDVRVALVVGGLAHEKQERLLAKRPEIVVATPGRLWEMVSNGNEHLQTINSVRFLAIDETDRMLEKGHFEELGQLLERVNFNEAEKSKRQNFVLSATLTVVHDTPVYIKGKKKKKMTSGQKLHTLISKIGITDYKVVDITRAKLTAQNLEERKILCEFEDKDLYLYHYLKTSQGRIIVFCNSIGSVKRMSSLLHILKLSPVAIHASMEQKQRLRSLDKFRASKEGILLATDVAARGLDIPGVDHVVHYHVPRTAETYIHRSGRTARKGLAGSALLLVDASEQLLYTRLVKTLARDKEIEDLELEVELIHHIKNIIRVAREIDKLSLAVKKQSDSQSWFQKAVDAMDLHMEDDEMPKTMSAEGNQKLKKDLQLKQKELNSLLVTQVLPRGYSGKYPDVFPQIRRDLLKIPGAFVLKRIPGSGHTRTSKIK